MMNPRFIAVVSFGGCVLAATLSACSDDDTGTPAGPSSGDNSSGGNDSGGGNSGSRDSGGTNTDAGAVVNGCRSFIDRSADNADRTIHWDYDIADLPERCMQIKVGQTVTFVMGDGSVPADFGTHPPIAQGGNTPNPMSELNQTSGEVTFDTAGLYGFACAVHPSMVGAFLVNP